MEGIYYKLLGECTEVSRERDIFVYFSYASKPFYRKWKLLLLYYIILNTNWIKNNKLNSGNLFL